MSDVPPVRVEVETITRYRVGDRLFDDPQKAHQAAEEANHIHDLVGFLRGLEKEWGDMDHQGIRAIARGLVTTRVAATIHLWPSVPQARAAGELLLALSGHPDGARLMSLAREGLIPVLFGQPDDPPPPGVLVITLDPDKGFRVWEAKPYDSRHHVDDVVFMPLPSTSGGGRFWDELPPLRWWASS